MKLRVLRRITLAAALAVVPWFAFGSGETEAKAKFGDWLHDEMQHRGLWLYGSPNLAIERAPANLPPRKSGRRWVLSRDAQTGAVVYFVPGDIRTIEIDSHRKVGTEADLVVSISPDGKLWAPLRVAAATLEVAGEWEYRLISANEVPTGMTHVRVEFPQSTKPPALRLTEVWIRFEWEPGLLDDAAKAATKGASVENTSATAKPASPEPIIEFAPAGTAAAAEAAEAAKAAEAATRDANAKAEPAASPVDSTPDHSLVLAATKAETHTPENPVAPAPATEVTDHSLALAATRNPGNPMEAVAEVAPSAPATDHSLALVATVETPAATNPVPVTEVATAPVSPANTPVVNAAENEFTEIVAPAVINKAAKKPVKKSSNVRVRRGPRSK